MLNKLLDILKTISEVIAKNDDYNMILSEIVKILALGLNADVCSIYIFDKKLNELHLSATYGLNKISVGQVKMLPGEGLTGNSFRKQKTMNISNPEKHPKYKYFENTGEEIFKSFLAIPLSVGGTCVGVLTIQDRNNKRFSSSVVDMMKSLSTQVANVILNENMLLALADENYDNSKKITTFIPRVKSQITIKGTAANSGVAIGKANIFSSTKLLDRISYSKSKNPEKEIQLLGKAIKRSKEETIQLEQKALSIISEADASIFDAHLLFLEDKYLIDKIKKHIKEHGHSLEFSIKLVFIEYEKRFLQLNEQIFKEKVMDLKDVMLRLIESARAIKNKKKQSDDYAVKLKNRILVAKELLPSDLIRMPIHNINGIVCEKGGITAHVAILARALGIPALLGVKKITKNVNDNDDLVLDCNTELVHVNPDAEIKASFTELVESEKEHTSFDFIDLEPGATSDKKHIRLNANLSLVSELPLINGFGAEGIGLYRTEFLYMVRDHLPSEEEQYSIYSKIFDGLIGKDITIRVLDIGGDKPLPYLNFPAEDNPALGNRGTRMLLNRKDILKPHLRAILRAGARGNLRVLFPMVTTGNEILQVRNILSEVEMELSEKNIPYSTNFKIGIMLEVPSIILDLENIISKVDFVSIGTNDLLQYIFAMDRGNESLPSRNLSLHPIFLKVLRNIGEIFKSRPEKELCLCGEMAGNKSAIPFIIGAGIYNVSMPSKRIQPIKEVVRNFTLEECKEILEEALMLRTPEAVEKLSKEKLIEKDIFY